MAEECFWDGVDEVVGFVKLLVLARLLLNLALLAEAIGPLS